MYSIQQITEIVSGSLKGEGREHLIEHLVYDSRRIQEASTSLFFALVTRHNNGHHYIQDAHRKGIRNFVVSAMPSENLQGSNFIQVTDTLNALQDLAAFHRSRFSIPVIGITGSNGKTIVKEWLYQVLQDEHNIVRSPKSYNSQVGVALSVWQMKKEHSLAIFEAGISEPGEMQKLAKMIRPALGLLTNIGAAHDDGFGNDRELKLKEKMQLFHDAGLVIIRDIDSREKKDNHLTLGKGEENDFIITRAERNTRYTRLSIQYKGITGDYEIPFSDEASLENAASCIALLLAMDYSPAFIAEKVSALHPIDMRLQLKHGINNCIIVNDSYSADLTSFKIALDFLKQQSAGLRPVVVLSDFFGSGQGNENLYEEIAALVESCSIGKVIAIGEEISHALQQKDRSFELVVHPTTEDFLLHSRTSDFSHEIILIKGARRFEFERIAQWLERKLHQTVLEINLNALVHNLKQYQNILSPGTRIMAMVKAFSYGSGGSEIASVLQYHNVDYLGVAYADEGIELVRSGISLPVMVMNTEISSFQAIVDFNLQPVIFSFALLESFENYVKEQGLQSYPVHIEIETGMNRLGFRVEEAETLAARLSTSGYLKVVSVFSHLAASEDPQQDSYTRRQSELFAKATGILASKLSYSFYRHISNSAAVVMHPEMQMDMVRLGIGLYGIEVDNKAILDLLPVASLRSTIAQIKKLSPGETVSYNRKGVVKEESIVGTVRIGYADGYSRLFSNGKGKMLVKGKLAPVIGTVCMDMTMIDLTGIEGVEEGDEVIVFGPELPIQTISSWIQAIPYEIMTGISQRVRRIYFHE